MNKYFIIGQETDIECWDVYAETERDAIKEYREFHPKDVILKVVGIQPDNEMAKCLYCGEYFRVGDKIILKHHMEEGDYLVRFIESTHRLKASQPGRYLDTLEIEYIIHAKDVTPEDKGDYAKYYSLWMGSIDKTRNISKKYDKPKR
jgi:hypothetical protein